MTLILAKCVCVHITYTLQHLQGRQQSPKSNIPLLVFLFLFLPSFLSPPSLPLAASLVSLIQSHNKHTYTLSRHIHRFRATKTPCCGSGSAFSEALVSLCLQMQSQNRETYNPCEAYKEIVYGGIRSRGGFSQVWWSSYLISRKMRLQVEVSKGTTRKNGKSEERKCRDEDIKKRSERRRQFLPH